jgi:hypothetical protein
MRKIHSQLSNMDPQKTQLGSVLPHSVEQNGHMLAILSLRCFICKPNVGVDFTNIGFEDYLAL